MKLNFGVYTNGEHKITINKIINNGGKDIVSYYYDNYKTELLLLYEHMIEILKSSGYKFIPSAWD